MADYDCLLVNGDSYSAPRSSHPVYADILARDLGVSVYNYARSGSNNDRICRTTIEYTNQALQQGRRPMVMVAWSFVRRQEVWYYGSNTHHMMPDQCRGDHHDPRFMTLDWLLQDGMATMEQKAMVSDPREIHKLLTDWYTHVYLLAHWLEHQGLPYFFFSGADNEDCPTHCFPFVRELTTVKWCQDNPRIRDLHGFHVSKWARDNDPGATETGHLSHEGHQKFAVYIKSWMDIHADV